MNPLPVSLDLSSNSNSKPSANVSTNNAGDADRFKAELNKQEQNTQDKELSSKPASDNRVQKNDPTEAAETATVAADESLNGEQLPLSPEGEELTYMGNDDNLEPLPELIALDELDITLSQVPLSSSQGGLEILESNERLNASIEPLGASMVFDNEGAISQIGYSSPASLVGSPNALPLSVNGVVSEGDLLEQPLEKLMTLEQIKVSLEKGIESLADLEVDVDSDSEVTVREVFRFNDLQLKESQSTLKSYTTSVEIPVSQGAWADKVNDKIIWLANQKIQFAEIHLNPQDLGPMEVKISVQNDQATVTFNSNNQGVRELLELNVNRLREMMNENGVDLAHVDVSDQSSEQQSADKQEAGDVDKSDGDEALSGLGEAGSITDAITLDNLVDYYA